MSGSSRSSKPTLYRRLAVLVCCVVSLTTPFDMDTVAQVLDGSLPPQIPLAVSVADDTDDEDNLARPATPTECRRDVRKQPRLAATSGPAPSGFVCPRFQWPCRL